MSGILFFIFASCHPLNQLFYPIFSAELSRNVVVLLLVVVAAGAGKITFVPLI